MEKVHHESLDFLRTFATIFFQPDSMQSTYFRDALLPLQRKLLVFCLSAGHMFVTFPSLRHETMAHIFNSFSNVEIVQTLERIMKRLSKTNILNGMASHITITTRGKQGECVAIHHQKLSVYMEQMIFQKLFSWLFSQT